jgi:hypothetical protein
MPVQPAIIKPSGSPTIRSYRLGRFIPDHSPNFLHDDGKRPGQYRPVSLVSVLTMRRVEQNFVIFLILTIFIIEQSRLSGLFLWWLF